MAGQLVAVVRHSRAVALARRTPIRPPQAPRRSAVAPTSRHPTITLTLRPRGIARALRGPVVVLSAILSHAFVGLKLAACALLAGMVALAIMNYRDGEPAVTGSDPVGNETIVYRRAATPSAPAQPQGTDAAAAEQRENAGTQYPRAVQTVRFVNPEPPVSVAAAARELIKRALTKVGAFVAFPSREQAQPESLDMRRKRGMVILDEIDDYLWEVYQRAPIKKDSSGDFTWKDPAAASRVGLALQDYVIGGMDPGFREQL